jgi:hypothetical protein
MDLEFRDNLSGAERDAAVQRLEKAIREKHHDINHIFIEAKSLSGNKPEGQRSSDSE